ncbi:MAG: RNA polymerase-binding protein Rnk [Betaproteobacteria bacterium]|nr:MAG: RNA polymerase-binding protein Rnk [Betaproteobacteria bacterium]
MRTGTAIWLTDQDYTRLKRVLDARKRESRSIEQELETLEELLELARVVRPERVPENVVTMNSRVLFRDVRTDDEGTVTIAYPSEADPSSGRISVLSPVGAVLIGSAEGDELELPLPHGQTRCIRIESVLYQPEAQGDFAL